MPNCSCGKPLTVRAPCTLLNFKDLTLILIYMSNSIPSTLSTGRGGQKPKRTNSRPHQSSTNAGTSTSGIHFVCSDWVSRFSIKRLKYLTRQFYLPSAILKLDLNDRPYTHPLCMAIFSKAIIQGGLPFLFTFSSLKCLTTSTLSFSISPPTQSTPWWYFTLQS